MPGWFKQKRKHKLRRAAHPSPNNRRLFIAAPTTFPALLQDVAAADKADPQQPGTGAAPGADEVAAVQQRFLDRWLSVANVTLLEGGLGLNAQGRGFGGSRFEHLKMVLL